MRNPCARNQEKEGWILDRDSIGRQKREQEDALRELKRRYPMRPDWEFVDVGLYGHINSLVESLNDLAAFVRLREALDAGWEEKLNDQFAQIDILLSDAFGEAYGPIIESLDNELSNLVRMIRSLQ